MTLISELNPSVRERIMRFLRSQLEGLQDDTQSPIVNVPVYRTRLDKLPEGQLPAFNLTIEDDKEISLSTDSIEHELLVNVDCITAAAEEDEDTPNPPHSIDEIADPLTVWAERQMSADITVGGLAIRIDWVDSHWTNVAQNLDITGVRKRFKVTYFSVPGDPTDPSNN